jgi:predicted dehydrogenase
MSQSAAPPVRVVVVGAGHLGRYHLEKFHAHPQARLVGVVDTDPVARAQAMQRFGIRGSGCVADFAAQADAAVVATPTASHLAVGSACLHLGLHVLMEKPLAATAAQAQALVQQAQALGRILQVGHVERFNPAVVAALQVAQKPRYIVAERLGVFSGRSTEVDVVLDLMVHDLEIVAALTPAALSEVRAVGMAVMTQGIDMAAARLAFADGTVAQLSAGRTSLEASRKLRLFSDTCYVSVDCISRQVKCVRRVLTPEGGAGQLPGELSGGVASGGGTADAVGSAGAASAVGAADLPAAAPQRLLQISGETLEVPPGDPLALQAAAFIEAVQHRRRPRVDGAAGLRAVCLAEAVHAAMQAQGPQQGVAALA